MITARAKYRIITNDKNDIKIIQKKVKEKSGNFEWHDLFTFGFKTYEEAKTALKEYILEISEKREIYFDKYGYEIKEMTND